MGASQIEYVEVDVDSLLLDDKNARQHDERNQNAVAASLTRWGQVENLVVQRSTRRVIAGNCRLGEMRRLGVRTARVALLDISDAQAAALAVALNRTGELANWDYAQLAETLGAMDDAADLIGWSESELHNLLNAQFSPDDDPDIPEFDDDDATGGDVSVEPIKLTSGERERFARVLAAMRETHKTSEGECVVALCDFWESGR